MINFLLTLFFSLFILSGCSGEIEDMSQSNSGQNSNIIYVTGKFVDSPVKGIRYACSSGSTEYTNTEGEFTCRSTDTVTFSIGAYEFTPVVAIEDLVVTPYTLFSEDLTAALNLARLLQSIDKNTDSAIIDIDTTKANLFSSDMNFSNADFEILTQEKIVPYSLMSASKAKINMDTALLGLGIDIPTY